nr:mannan polymerase ii complex anp1 subunit [Quercus suber]
MLNWVWLGSQDLELSGSVKRLASTGMRHHLSRLYKDRSLYGHDAFQVRKTCRNSVCRMHPEIWRVLSQMMVPYNSPPTLQLPSCVRSGYRKEAALTVVAETSVQRWPVGHENEGSSATLSFRGTAAAPRRRSTITASIAGDPPPPAMLLPKGGVSWKAARARIPPYRTILRALIQSRLLLAVAAIAIVLLVWDGLRGTAGEAQWAAHLQTPVIFNHHAPIEVNSSTIERVDLNPIHSTPKAITNEERVLILTPLRNAAPYIEQHFDLLTQLTYPHHLIDLAFLVGDSTDDTLAVLAMELERTQSRSDKVPFRSAMIVEKDFGVTLSQNVEDRHGFAAQGPRRKAMGKARNYLLSAAMKPEHSWVYWRDVDIKDSPKQIIEDFVAHDRDILESETGRKLSASLDKDVVLAEGYKEYKTDRTYMAKMGNWQHDKDTEIPLDGIGGVNILVKADVHRAAETEGFAKMAKRAGYGVYGLPNYVVWHIDTDEKPGNA